jgi:anti-anti-sigma factor
LQIRQRYRKVGGVLAERSRSVNARPAGILIIGGEFVDVSVINHGTATVIRLRGSLKLGNGVEDLTKTFDQIFQQGQKKVVLSIAEVPMVDSSGIGLLVRSHTHCVKQGGGITLVQPSKFVIQTLQLVGVLRMFPVVESEEQGLA